MNNTILKSLHDKVFVCLICLLAIIASLGGLGIRGLYHDNIYVISSWKGHDVITLFICVPALFVSLLYAQWDLNCAKVISIGSVGYLAYTYALYAFTAAYNNFFLIYIAIMSLSVMYLVDVVSRFDANNILEWEEEKIFRNLIIAALLLSPVFVMANSLGMITQSLKTNTIPEAIAISGHPTSPMFALDLGFDIPVTLYALMQLLRKKYSGYVLTGIILTTKSIEALALITTSFLANAQDVKGASDMLPIWIFLFLLNMLSLVLFILKSPLRDNFFAPYYWRNLMNMN